MSNRHKNPMAGATFVFVFVFVFLLWHVISQKIILTEKRSIENMHSYVRENVCLFAHGGV